MTYEKLTEEWFVEVIPGFELQAIEEAFSCSKILGGDVIGWKPGMKTAKVMAVFDSYSDPLQEIEVCYDDKEFFVFGT